MSQNKCQYFDKGYCKRKDQCQELHLSTDCDGKCLNKTTCPLRHRVECKNGNECVFKTSNSCAFLHPKELFLDNKKIDLVEKQLDIVNNQIIGMDKKLNLLEQQGEAGIQTSKVTKDLLNQVARLTTENKEQQKQLAESKLNIEMAIEKINNIDEEYSDKIEELSNSTDTEWRASHKELKEKLWTLEKQITSVHPHVFLQSKHAVQVENKTNDNVIYIENQPKTYNDEDPEKYKCDQCSLGFMKKWVLGKHVKDIHKEDKCNDQPQMEGSNAYNVNTQGSIRESLPREGNI